MIGHTKDDAIELPLPDDKHHHNSILHLKDQIVINYDMSPKKTLDKPELHEHILILHKNDESDLNTVDDHERTSAVVCDACVEPIINNFDKELQHDHHYRCRDYCRNFFLHLSCAELLKPELDHQAHKAGDDQHILELFKRPPSDKLLSLFTCECCGRKCNGFAYGCKRCDFYLDVVCAFLPKLIRHGVAHDKFHVLSLCHSSSTRFLNMSNTKNNLWFYDCMNCSSFTLHAKCALLPGIAHVGSEFDEHTLKLVPPVPDYDIYSSEDHFCEICEEEIDVRGGYTRNKWYYSCSDKCDRLFHVECLPSVSPALSMVKFGQGIRVNCHECEVVSVRMLTVGSHQCGYCNKIIEGRKDEIAFKCSQCNFWMHYECAEKCRQ